MKGLQVPKIKTKEDKKMKVKFKYGIKSYSGTCDELTYANYESRSVVIGRMLAVNKTITPQNVLVGNRSVFLGDFYNDISGSFKQDLKVYAKKMYNLKKYRKKLSGSSYTIYNKIMWAAAKDSVNPLELGSLSVDDLSLGTFPNILTVKAAVDCGYLPKVKGYEALTNNIVA